MDLYTAAMKFCMGEMPEAEFRKRAREWQRDIDAKAPEPPPVRTRPGLSRATTRLDAPRFRT